MNLGWAKKRDECADLSVYQSAREPPGDTNYHPTLVGPEARTPDMLDVAIAATQQARREILERRARNQIIRMLIALGFSGCVAIFALAAYLAGDHATTRSLGMTAYIVFTFTCITGLAARERALDALRQVDKPN